MSHANPLACASHAGGLKVWPMSQPDTWIMPRTLAYHKPACPMTQPLVVLTCTIYGHDKQCLIWLSKISESRWVSCLSQMFSLKLNWLNQIYEILNPTAEPQHRFVLSR